MVRWKGAFFSFLCNVGGPQTNVEVTRHLFHRNMFVGVSNLTFSSKPPSDSRVLSHSLCSFQMGGGFPSGELMLVAQKSQTGSGPDIFSWMNVMLTLSKGFVKRNMLTTTKDYVYLLLGIFQIRGKSTGKDMFIFKLTEAPNRNVHCPIFA